MKCLWKERLFFRRQFYSPVITKIASPISSSISWRVKKSFLSIRIIIFFFDFEGGYAKQILKTEAFFFSSHGCNFWRLASTLIHSSSIRKIQPNAKQKNLYCIPLISFLIHINREIIHPILSNILKFMRQSQLFHEAVISLKKPNLNILFLDFHSICQFSFVVFFAICPIFICPPL